MAVAMLGTRGRRSYRMQLILGEEGENSRAHRDSRGADGEAGGGRGAVNRATATLVGAEDECGNGNETERPSGD